MRALRSRLLVAAAIACAACVSSPGPPAEPSPEPTPESAAAVAVPAVALPAARTDDDVLRADIDDLVRRSWDVRFERLEGPSPATRVRRLLAAGDERLRGLLEEAWSAYSDPASPAGGALDPLALLAAFLYEVDPAPVPGPSVWTDLGGVVTLVERADIETTRGSYAFVTQRPTLRAFLGDARPRALPAPVAAALLARSDSAPPPASTTRGWMHFAMTLGEACAADPAVRAELVRRARARADDLALTVALGWAAAGDDEALALLRRRAAERSPAMFPGNLSSRALVPSALFDALRHADPRALLGVLAPPGAPASVRDLRAAGFETALPILADDLARAASEDARRAAIARLREFLEDDVGSPRWVRPLPADATTSILLALADALPGADPSVGADVLACVAWICHPHRSEEYVSGRAGFSAMGGPLRVIDTPAYLPVTDGPTFLATLAQDVRSGALRLRDGLPNLREHVPGVVRWDRTLRSTAEPPPAFATTPWRDDGDPPVRLRATWTDAGLELTMLNEGVDRIAVDPVALRYATGGITRAYVVAESGPGQARVIADDSALTIQLGDLPLHAATDASNLHVLPAGASYTWTIPVRGECRRAAPVWVSATRTLALAGSPPAPLLTGFLSTWASER